MPSLCQRELNRFADVPYTQQLHAIRRGDIACSVARDDAGFEACARCLCQPLLQTGHGADFSGQPAVINGFSDLMLEVFGERGMHARSAMGAYALPQNVPVSVDCIFKLR